MMMKESIFDNIWFVRIISLAFALFLYAFVSSENSDQFQAISNQQFASIETSETISNVPVYLGEHDEDVFVSEMPESVTVKLTGPRNIITQVTVEDFIVQTEDIRGIDTGRQTIRLIAIGLPEEIDYQITPVRHVVQISRRETVTLPVEYELDDNLLAEGFEIGEITLSPSEVTLTGKAETIADIDRVLIKINRDTLQSENFIQKYRLQILNSEGQLLDVNASASEIDADVEVVPIVKDVDLSIVPVGEDTSKYAYEYAFVGPAQATIQANTNVLNQISSANLIVDVSTLTETTTVTGNLELPANVVSGNPTTSDVQVIITSLVAEETSSSEPTSETAESSIDSSALESISSEDETSSEVSEETSSQSSE